MTVAAIEARLGKGGGEQPRQRNSRRQQQHGQPKVDGRRTGRPDDAPMQRGCGVDVLLAASSHALVGRVGGLLRRYSCRSS